MASRKRYLVGVDFSRASLRALKAARTLASRTGASVTIAHVRPSSDMRAAVVEERGDLLRSPAGSLRAALAAHYERRLGAVVDPGAAERPLVLSGAPDVALRKEARRGYELVILGDRGRGAVSSIFLGSTAQRVAARSPIPVMIVPAARRA